MKPVLDKSMFREATTDSGSLAAMSSIIHRIAEPGEYRGIVYRGTTKVGKFPVSVCNCTEPPTAASLPQQATIDLTTLDSSTGAKAGNGSSPFLLRTGGYLVFTVSTGSGEYAVELFRTERKMEAVRVFDSRTLGSGDIFAANIIRPGAYTVRNASGKGQADLTVEYPETGKLMMRMKPFLVECKDGAINPSVMKILPAQALMFGSQQEFRIIIELKKAHDRPRPVRSHFPVRTEIMKKEKPGTAGPKKIIRKIQFFG